MRIRIEIDTGNAAFEESWTAEVQFILEELAAKIADDGPGAAWNHRTLPLRDTYGNKCGKVEFTEVEP